MSMARRARRNARKTDKEKRSFMEVKVTVRQCVELYTSSVGSSKFVDPGATVAVAQIIYAVRPVVDKYDEMRAAILRKYGQVGEDGELVTGADKNVVLIGETPAEKADSRRKLDAENKAMLDADVTVTVPPIDTARLNADGLTPFALVSLLPFVVAPVADLPKAP